MTEHAVLTAVRALAPAVRERAAEAESLRRLPDATVKELAAAGAFRLLQPQAYGGLSADPAVFYQTLRELGRACGSTGWVSGVFGVNAWIVARYDPQAQQDVWGADDSVRIGSSLAPVGEITPVAGGFRVRGHWGFASGCDHAQWMLLGGIVRDAGAGADARPGEMRLFLLPQTDYTVDPVWDTVGLRGTGSHDVVVRDAFVPEHRTMPLRELSTCGRPGHTAHEEPLYRLPMGPVLTTSISAPIVGMAEAAYEGYLAATRDRVRGAGGTRMAEDPHTHVRIGRAASEIDAAWLQLTRNIADLYDCARRGEEPAPALRARLRRDQVRATERAVYAVDILMESAGGGAMRTGDSVVQRAWRDVHTGRGHITNDPERSLALFARDALGFDIRDDPML